MNDTQKSKQQLIEELHRLRARVDELEASTKPKSKTDSGLHMNPGRLWAPLDEAPESINIVDLDFRLTDVNESMLKRFGLSGRESVLGQHCYEVFKGRDDICPDCRVAEVYRTGVPVHRTTGPVDFDAESGEFMEIRAYPIVDRKGKIVAAVEFVRDVAEREIAKRELELSESKYRALVEFTSDLVWESGKDGIFVHASPSIKDILGYEPDEVLGRSAFDMMPPDQLEKAHTLAKDRRQNREPFTGVEISMLHKDGHRVILEANGVPVRDLEGNHTGFRGISRDITERKKAEQALRKSEELFRAVFESSSDCIIVWDKDYNYLYANQSAIDHVNVARERVIGMNIRDGLGHVPEFMKIWMGRVDTAFASGETKSYEDAGPVGEKLVFSESVVSPMRDDKGNIFAASVVYRDITRRKQAEQELQERHDELREIYDGMVDGMLVFDMESKNILRANRSIREMLGYSGEELTSMSVGDLHRPKDISGVMAAFEAVCEDISVSVRDFPFRRKDGSLLYTDSNVNQIEYNGRQCLIGFFRDTTDRRQALKSLAQTETQYREIVDSTTDGLLVADWDGNIVQTNPAFCLDHGYASEEIVGNPPNVIIHPDYEYLLDEFWDTMKSGGVFRAESVDVRKDGSCFDVDVRGTRFDFKGKPHALVMIRDVSKRKQAEKAARQSHLELRAIYDGMVDGLLIEDIETKSFVRANRAVCGMLGYSREELLTMSSADIHRPEDLPAAKETFDALVKKHITMAENVPFLRKDGTVIYADITAAHILYNERPCIIGFFRDVTKRREAEEAVVEEQRHLRRLLEMHEQNRKLVAYEIHDGLVQSLVAARMLLEGAKHIIDDHGADADKQSCNSGLQLLGGAVDQARILMGGQRPLILDERGLLAAIEYLTHEGEKLADIDIRFTHDVKFDRLAPPLETAVFRIVQECLTNARRHSQSEKVRVELAQNNGQLELSVEDWGTGFQADTVAQNCFGLEGVQERTRLFGGKINIDSAPGKGTRISVKLPVVEA